MLYWIQPGKNWLGMEAMGPNFNMPPTSITMDKTFKRFCQEIHIDEQSQLILIAERCCSMDTLRALHEEYITSTPVSQLTAPLRKRPWIIAATSSILSR